MEGNVEKNAFRNKDYLLIQPINYIRTKNLHSGFESQISQVFLLDIYYSNTIFEKKILS